MRAIEVSSMKGASEMARMIAWVKIVRVYIHLKTHEIQINPKLIFVLLQDFVLDNTTSINHRYKIIIII